MPCLFPPVSLDCVARPGVASAVASVVVRLQGSGFATGSLDSGKGDFCRRPAVAFHELLGKGDQLDHLAIDAGVFLMCNSIPCAIPCAYIPRALLLGK